MMKHKITRRFGMAVIAVFIVGSVAFKSDFFEIAKQLEIYTDVFKQLDMYYVDAIDPVALNQKALKAMLKSLDPYTVFYDEQGIEDVRIRRSGEYGGIGAYTRYKNQRLYILEPYKDAPADKAGLKAGDEILKIDDILLKDYKEKSVGRLLRGVPNTTVELEILRQGKKQHVTVKREKIIINPVPFYDMIEEEVGYITLVKFNQKTTREVTKAYEDLKSRGMKKLVFDIRSNPGGLLNQAISITNLFIPKDKVVVKTQSKVKKWSNTYKTRNEALDTEIPIVVLVNGRSASASEIVSGSLQDYDRAVIMGERTFGKGLVQRYRKLSYGTQMKLTISKYYTPSGRCIQELDYTNRDHETGIVPKFSDGKVNMFKTANGRKVYDGGGVKPDVEIAKPKTLKITKELFASDAFFNFVTDYYYTHPEIGTARTFQIEDKVYDDLKTYLIAHSDSYETKMDKSLDDTWESVKKEGLEKSVESDYKLFKQALTKSKVRELDANKDEIMERLTEEIVKRYYYKEGVYQQKMAFDPAIVQAVNLLHQPKKYRKILR